MQRKGLGIISGARNVLRANRNTNCVDAMSDHELRGSNVNSLPDVGKSQSSLAYSDHLYCRLDQAASDRKAESVEPELKDGITDVELSHAVLQQSSESCVRTESEDLDELSSSCAAATHSNGSVCSVSDESSGSKCDLSCGPTAEMVEQSLDATWSTLGGTSELDVVDTEDVSLGSSATSGVCTLTAVTVEQSLDATWSTLGGTSEQDVADTENVSLGSSATSGVCTLLQDEVTSISDSTNKQLNDTVTGDSCEVVDLTDGRPVELECQCGAHYSDPNDRLHVVECRRCHSYQHATCVKYDLSDPLRGNYLCPHCHVVEVGSFQT